MTSAIDMAITPRLAGGGLYLHRSELHAQRELEVPDPKAGMARAPAKTSARVRALARGPAGFQQGLQERGVPFKALGVLKDRKELEDAYATEMARVDRERRRAIDSEGHVEPRKPQPHDRGATGRNDGGDDAEGDDNEDRGGSAQHENQGGDFFQSAGRRSQPRFKGRRDVDGIGVLYDYLKKSDVRLQKIRAEALGAAMGQSDGLSEIEALMPSRSLYPPPGSGRSGSKEIVAAPHSARESGGNNASRQLERQAPHSARGPVSSPRAQELRLQPHAAQLPSLSDFIASSGSVGPSIAERSQNAASGVGRPGERSQLRDAINDLLGLPHGTSLKLSQEEMSSKRKINFRRKLDKQFDKWSQESELRKFWRTCFTVERKDKEKEAGDMATDDRGDRGDHRHGKAEGAAGGAGGGEATGGASTVVGDDNGAGAAASSGGGTGRRRQRENEKGAGQGDEMTGAQRLPREKDGAVSPVTRLRAALASYQASRDKHRDNLESTLVSMDANRLSALRRRAVSARDPRSKASSALERLEAERKALDQQSVWYTKLWSYVERERRDMPMAAHFIFCFVKQVHECGMIFTAEMYFAMLGQVEQSEYTAAVASLVVNMASGIDGVTTEGILDWFRRSRGEVPAEVAALCSSTSSNDAIGSVQSPVETAARPAAGSADSTTKDLFLGAAAAAGAETGASAEAPEADAAGAPSRVTFATAIE